MFVPKQFRIEDPDKAIDFIKENSFGILVSQKEGKLLATHIPLEYSIDVNTGEAILSGHIAKANEQSKGFEDGDEVLAIFNGPHAYISSSWYDHENVPTWNYVAVHVYGKIQMQSKEQLLHSLKELVDKYEYGNENPTSIEKMSEQTLKQVNGIVGFNIHIHDIQAAYKMSQNRHNDDYQNIIKELESKEDNLSNEVAKEMKCLRPLE